MLKIKLARFGKRKQPHYRVVINEARDKRDGSYVEMIGYYGPTQKPKLLEIDVKKYDAWVAKGAQPTETVAFLYEVAKSGKGFPAKKPKPSKKKLAAKEEPKEEPKKEPKEEVAKEKTEEKVEEKAEEKAEKKAEDKKPETTKPESDKPASDKADSKDKK